MSYAKVLANLEVKLAKLGTNGKIFSKQFRISAEDGETLRQSIIYHIASHEKESRVLVQAVYSEYQEFMKKKETHGERLKFFCRLYTVIYCNYFNSAHKYRRFELYKDYESSTKVGRGLHTMKQFESTLTPMFEDILSLSNNPSWARRVDFDIFEFLVCYYQIHLEVNRKEPINYFLSEQLVKHIEILNKYVIRLEEELILHKANQMFGVNQTELTISLVNKKLKVVLNLPSRRIGLSDIFLDETI